MENKETKSGCGNCLGLLFVGGAIIIMIALLALGLINGCVNVASN